MSADSLQWPLVNKSTFIWIFMNKKGDIKKKVYDKKKKKKKTVTTNSFVAKTKFRPTLVVCPSHPH